MPKIKELETGNRKFSPDRLRIPAGRGLLAIDPGDVHVGVAMFAEDQNGFPYCEWATEYGHDEGTDFVARQLASYTLCGIALERFNLYQDQKDKQVGSDFPTCEQIGVIKYMVRVNNESRGLTGEGVETAGWAGDCLNYFAVMRSIRSEPDLWLTHTTDPKVRARQIEKSIRDCKQQILAIRAGFNAELEGH
jgi:hypothetical protein